MGLPLLQLQIVILCPFSNICWCNIHLRCVHYHPYFRLNFYSHIHNPLLVANNWDVITIQDFYFRVVVLSSDAILSMALITNWLNGISVNFLLVTGSPYFKFITTCPPFLLNFTVK